MYRTLSFIQRNVNPRLSVSIQEREYKSQPRASTSAARKSQGCRCRCKHAGVFEATHPRARARDPVVSGFYKRNEYRRMTNAPLQNDPSDKRVSGACDGEIFGFSTIVPRGTSSPRVRHRHNVHDLVSPLRSLTRRDISRRKSRKPRDVISNSHDRISSETPRVTNSLARRQQTIRCCK